MSEISSPLSSPRQNSASPPPKCAICLGTCTNKCFSNSCMHQFCYLCLLEWSKIKAECPLCKQTFKSIIYNIKSNSEYDEHFIVNEPAPTSGLLSDGNLYIPSRHFQFRTTFTVDPGGELAIQQMLLSHPLTNSLYNVPDILPRPSRFGRLRNTRRASSATSFRRQIYMFNMWVYAPPDFTGRYRDVAPHFYRENPAARNRLVPWLNRELNALLRENTQQVMYLVDVIMEHLPRWHIQSRSFKQLLSPYLNTKTNHFIHEFYNFMRSPFDMIGYDRHIVYGDQHDSPYLISDSEEDSDITIVNISEPIAVNNNPFRSPTIEVIEINSDSSHDSDVIIGEPPTPEIVLIESDSDDHNPRTPERAVNNTESEQSETNRRPILPLKIRLKSNQQTKDKRSTKKRSKRRRSSSRSSSSSSSSSNKSSTDSGSSTSPSRESPSPPPKNKSKRKKQKSRVNKEMKLHQTKTKRYYKNKSSTGESSEDDCSTQESCHKRCRYDKEDNIPLSKIKRIEMKKRVHRKRTTSNSSKSQDDISSSHMIASIKFNKEDVKPNISTTEEKPSCSGWISPEVCSASTSYNGPNSSFKPVTSSNLAGTSNMYDGYSYNYSNPSYFKYEQYQYSNNLGNNALPQFENINHFENFKPYRISEGASSPPINFADYRVSTKSESYTPPLPPPVHTTSQDNLTSYNNVTYKTECPYENSNSNYSDKKLFKYYSPPNNKLPSKVNVSVGTSPIKVEEDDYNYAGPSNSQRVHSVIVKKDPYKLYQYYNNNSNSSDSDPFI